MPSAAVRKYWDWLPDICVCGRQSEQIHHILSVNYQRISKDDWIVVKLCADCHTNGNHSVHRLGSERKFEEVNGIDLLQRAILSRHDYEVTHG